MGLIDPEDPREMSHKLVSEMLNLSPSPVARKLIGRLRAAFKTGKPYQGIVEGINNKLKPLKRCGFGFRNFNNFEMRALLFWHFTKDLAH